MNDRERPEITCSQDNFVHSNPYVPSTQPSQRHNVYQSVPNASVNTSATQVQAVPQRQSEYWIFNRFQKIFAVISLLLAYLMKSCVFTTGGVGIYALMFFEVTLAAALVYLIKIGAKFKAPTVIWYSLLAIYPVSFVIIDNPAIKFLGAMLLILMIMMFLYTAASGIKCFKESFLYDFLQAIFVAPFKYFPTLPVALFKPARDSRGKKVVRYVLIGLLIALPLTAVLLGILVVSDEAFRSFIGQRFFEELFEVLGDVFLSIPLAFLIFSVITFSYRDRRRVRARVSTPVTLKSRGNGVIFITLFIPVIILYIIFFFSQFAYFTDAFKNILPEDFTYSEYAVHGFFEMCLVVFINIVLVMVTLAICRKNEHGRIPVILMFEMIVISVFSLMFVAVAIAKTVMYTNAYGLTHLRVYALFVIAALVAMVLISVLKAMIPKLSFFKVSVCALAVIIFSVSFINVDAVIAKYNVKWYKEGRIGWMGEKALYELDKSSVPYLAELLDEKETVGNEIVSSSQWYCENYYYYEDYYYDYDYSYGGDCDASAYESIGTQITDYFKYLRSYEYDNEGFNLAAYRAEKIFEQNNIEKYSE